jgi:hypothetical protein
MSKQLLKYILAGFLTATAAGIATAQTSSLGHTTPAASTAHAGGLSYTYAIGRTGHIVAAIKPSDAPKKQSEAKQSDASAAARPAAATAYPNPCANYLKIKASTPIESVKSKIQIIDGKGGTAATMDAPAGDNGEITIDMSRLAPGKYIIRIITDNGIYTATAIKI